MSKVEQLPTGINVQAFLNTLPVEQIKGILVLAMTHDGVVKTGWINLDVFELTFLSRILGREIDVTFLDEDEEDEGDTG